MCMNTPVNISNISALPEHNYFHMTISWDQYLECIYYEMTAFRVQPPFLCHLASSVHPECSSHIGNHKTPFSDRFYNASKNLKICGRPCRTPPILYIEEIRIRSYFNNPTKIPSSAFRLYALQNPKAFWHVYLFHLSWSFCIDFNLEFLIARLTTN